MIGFRNFIRAMAAIGALLAGTVAGNARPVTITSGEHENFSRLVLYFSQPGNWEFTRVEDGYEFRAPEADITYDLRRAFERIPRDRISDIRDLGDGRLLLKVDCTCYGEAFSLDGGEIVLDILDGPPPAAAEPSRPFPEPVPPETIPPETRTAQQRPAHDRNGLPILFPEGAGLPWLAALHQPGDRRETETAPAGPPEAPDPPTELLQEPKPEPETAGRVAETEELLLEQIGRAASQGLLEPDLSEIESAVDAATQAGAPDDQRSEAPDTEPDTAETLPEDHVLIENVLDRTTRSETAPRGITSLGLACPNDADFDIATWGNDPSEGIELGPYRNQVLAEFDRARPEQVVKLVQYYLYLTFGAEARAVLDTYGVSDDRGETLRMMAEIVDGLSSQRGRNWSPFQECDGNAAMWAVLAQETLAPEFELNEAAVSSTFSALPIHLRQRFGLALAERLIAAGKVDLATRLRDAVQRGTPAPTPQTTYLEAQIAMVEAADSRKVVRDLESVIENRSGEGAQALVDLIEYKLDNGIGLTSRDLELVSSFGFENQGTDTGQRLQELEIQALAAASRFRAAFSRLEELRISNELQPAAADRIARQLVSKLTENGSDAQFLRYALKHAPQLDLSETARLAVAQRMADLGFVQEARQLLEKSDEVPNPAERQLFARIALAESRPKIALGYLAGLKDAASLSLRAQALAEDQKIAAALQIYTAMDDLDNVMELAYRSGDWQRIAALEEPGLAEIGKMALAETRFPEDAAISANMLSIDAELLANSRRTRTMIEDLLSQFSQ